MSVDELWHPLFNDIKRLDSHQIFSFVQITLFKWWGLYNLQRRVFWHNNLVFREFQKYYGSSVNCVQAKCNKFSVRENDIRSWVVSKILVVLQKNQQNCIQKSRIHAKVPTNGGWHLFQCVMLRKRGKWKLPGTRGGIPWWMNLAKSAEPPIDDCR